jgi:hypothetical protein
MSVKEIKEIKSRAAETAVYRAPGDYKWFKFTGATFTVENRKGVSFEIAKGDNFGAILVKGGTKIRICLAKRGLYKPFIADAAFAKFMGDHCKPIEMKDAGYVYE